MRNAEMSIVGLILGLGWVMAASSPAHAQGQVPALVRAPALAQTQAQAFGAVDLSGGAGLPTTSQASSRSLSRSLAAIARATSPAAAGTLSFWRESLTQLYAFAPGSVTDDRDGRLWFTGWLGHSYQARFWPGRPDQPCVVALADLPDRWRPPRDGLTWLLLSPLPWSTEGLPDADSYCLRAQALVLAQLGEVLDRRCGHPVQMIIVAGGMSSVAALGLACADPGRVAGLVLVGPRPYHHLASRGAGFDGPEAPALTAFVADHPAWLPAMRKSLTDYDIATLGPLVRAPVVVVEDSSRWPAWLAAAHERAGWQTIPVEQRFPTVSGIAKAAWFRALWEECLADLSGEGAAADQDGRADGVDGGAACAMASAGAGASR